MLVFTSLFNIKNNFKQRILFVLIFSITGFISRFAMPNPYATYFNLILCVILIITLFKVSLFKALLCEIVPTLISTLVDFILLKIFSLLFGMTTQQAQFIPIYRIIFSVSEYIFMYLIYLIIQKTHIVIPLPESKFKSKKDNHILYFNALLGIISISSQMYISAFHINVLPVPIVFFSLSSLIAYFIISIYSLISTSKLNIAKQNLEETKLMNKTLTILNDKIRAFRHDFNNIIQALGGYIQAKDMDGLEKYYSQLLKDCQEVTNLSGLNPESINNPAIYSLLASKYYLATEKGIEFNLDIFMDLNSIDMKIYEFCRILGILLDNAIQATQECEEKHITVTIRKDNKCKRQLLIVENTYKEKDIDTEKIFEKGYSTKEGNTGLGLWEVRQILLKNTNLNLFTSKDAKYFKQQLEIYKS